MKMTLLRNYWLVIMAWGLYLNGHVILASFLMLMACGLLLIVKSEVNLWRVAAVSLLACGSSLIVLMNTNIPYFFPDLKYFLILTSLDCGLANEYLYVIRKRFILPVLITVILYLCGLFAIVGMLPEQSCTIFGKGNICLMAMFIFSPYLIAMILACLFQGRVVLSKNGGLTSLH
ncbi:MAG: hypothetical protein IIZ80_07985 [Erysipelotrichaceae bacterium]|nr:hypothetical protein [Erysipelotrichaceae bacterium]